ncbi:uncharacterized protein LDX57_010092 [Aspergillus melleus]|uniref:uncharacterized protein n=1 Tax=Aspergillus melleus TaxID=138277 RepID=UPI001E8EC697|nr:uncharacterized protein LDX57_010092 [Aspergillus melleus]KAH8432456.1 hypothetical protein LDX57_010092 [Aspergillus melleus]
MLSDIVRERIEVLIKEIHQPTFKLSDDQEVSDQELGKLNIRRISFEPEELDSKTPNIRAQDPPILFQPMTPEEFARHPIDHSSGPDSFTKFRDYHPIQDQAHWWTPFYCAYEILNYLEDYASGEYGKRKNIRPEALTLVGLRGLEHVRYPNPLGLFTTFYGRYSLTSGAWSAKIFIEPKRIDGKHVHPHLTLGVLQHVNGREGTMLYGELDPVITMMYARSQQPDVSQEEEEALFEPEAMPEFEPKAFKNEDRFPILLLSFLGPQHGRVFYACMNGDQLVIRQSRLYDFRKLESAPFDLFSRLLLSQPLPTS